VGRGHTKLHLPVGAISDAVIYIESAGFLDKVYVSNGYWFAWDDVASGGTSRVTLSLAATSRPAIGTAADWFANPPRATIVGRVTAALSWGHIGMGYSFKQARMPLDLTDAKGIAFWAKGDGKEYRLKAESTAVTDNDYHGADFRAPSTWSLVRVPFSALKQEGWGRSRPWNPRSIHTLSFVTLGRPLESVRLSIDRLSLLGASTT
jgi:hypothetical protein